MLFKKKIALLMIVMLLTSLTACGKGTNTGAHETTPTVTPTGSATTPTGTEPANTPQVVTPEPKSAFIEGYETNGFRVIRVEQVSGVDGNLIFLEHVKSGAQLIYQECKNRELTFGTAFRTPSMSDNGIQHIVEHCVMSGSEKYPDSSLLRKMLYQTYHTCLNAYSAPGVTFFPVASYSEEQLFTLMDAYMSGVLHPLFLKDENIVKREGVHYEIDSTNDMLQASGIIYNEIKQYFLNDSIGTEYTALKELYPNHFSGFISSGYPDDILDVQYADVVDFYNRYYHPSNMLLFLSGGFTDVEKFLQGLDREYLNLYEKKEIEFPEQNTDLQKGFREIALESFVTSPSENLSNALYSVIWEDDSAVGRKMAQMVASQLSDRNSSFYQTVMEELSPNDLIVTANVNCPYPILNFQINRVKTDAVKRFQQLVDAELTNISKGKFDKDLLTYELNQLRYAQASANESYNFGTDFFRQCSLRWAFTGDVHTIVEEMNAVTQIQKAAKENTLEELVKKGIRNPEEITAVLTCEKQLLKQKDERTKLAEIQKSMDSERLQQIASETKAYREWMQKDTGEDEIKKLQVINIQDLPESSDTVPLKDETRDGIRYVSSEVPDSDTFSFTMYLNAGGIIYDSLLDAAILPYMLGNVKTANYSKKSLRSFRLTKLTSVEFSLERQYYDDEPCNQYLVVSAYGMKDQLADTLTYIEEVLFTSDLNDYEGILYAGVDAYNAFYKTFLSADFVMLAGAAAESEDKFLEYHMMGSGEYFNNLYQLCFNYSEDLLSAKATKFNSIMKNILHSSKMIVSSVGDGEVIAESEKKVAGMLDKLNPNAVLQQDYSKYFAKWKKHVAIIGAYDVAYNLQAINLKKIGKEDDGKAFLMGMIAAEKFLFPTIREQNNAYGVEALFLDDLGMIVSISDPNIAETYQAYGALGEQMSNLSITQEEIDGYVLSAYSMLMEYSGPMTTAENNIHALLSHTDTDRQRKFLHTLKSMTPEDVKEYASMFDQLCEQGTYITMASDAMFAKYPDLVFEQEIR